MISKMASLVKHAVCLQQLDIPLDADVGISELIRGMCYVIIQTTLLGKILDYLLEEYGKLRIYEKSETSEATIFLLTSPRLCV